MRKRYAFCIISNHRTPTRQIIAPRPVVFAGVILLAAFLIALPLVLYDYADLVSIREKWRKSRAEFHYQMAEAAVQRNQIEELAEEINALRSHLAALKETERNIRILADVENGAKQDARFGIGGSLPEDIDTGRDLTAGHERMVREMYARVKRFRATVKHQYDDYDSLMALLEEKQDFFSSTPGIRPTDGLITSRFGKRKSPFTGRSEFHHGVDIASKNGTSIVATANGIVTFVGRRGHLGTVITIDHGLGMVTRYGHIQKALKKSGDTVKRGECIALMGQTGRTTGPHVHYEVRFNDISINPEHFIPD